MTSRRSAGHSKTTSIKSDGEIDIRVNCDDQLFAAPGIDIADMLKGDGDEMATAERGKCAPCEELKKAVDGHERRAEHLMQEKELA
jgi:hypothetical protein